MTGGTPEKRVATRIAERCRIHYRVVDSGIESSSSGADSTDRVESADRLESNPKRVATETLNLSSSGLCLLAQEALRPDQHLALELDLTGRDQSVVAVGRVVWCDRDGTAYRVGVCFTWLRDDDRRDLGRIAEYVAARIDEQPGSE